MSPIQHRGLSLNIKAALYAEDEDGEIREEEEAGSWESAVGPQEETNFLRSIIQVMESVLCYSFVSLPSSLL